MQQIPHVTHVQVRPRSPRKRYVNFFEICLEIKRAKYMTGHIPTERHIMFHLWRMDDEITWILDGRER